MSDIADLERRITAALGRISTGLEGMARPAAPQPDLAPEPAPETEAAGPPDPAPAIRSDEVQAEIASLTAALAEERALSAQLQDRLRAVRDKDGVVQSQQDQRVERMTRQLDVQGLELQRMRKTAVSLREQLRTLRSVQGGSIAEPSLINKAMLAELEALRATRLTEMAEMDDIIAELTPMITEAEHA